MSHTQLTAAVEAAVRKLIDAEYATEGSVHICQYCELGLREFFSKSKGDFDDKN